MNATVAEPRRFYGWPLVGIGFVVYGLGIGPGYYSWGFFAPEVMADIGLTRQQVGQIFGAFTLTFAVAGPLAAWSIRSWGLRGTVAVGALVAALGFWLTSRADSVSDLFLSYSLVGGMGIGLSTVLPAQTLPVFWFKRYRARATAIILLGAAVVGGLTTPVDNLILHRWDWRTGWIFIASISVLVALISALFLRNKPEDLGQRRDGRKVDELPEAEKPVSTKESEAVGSASDWTLGQAVRTPQFLLALFAGMANTLPWRVLTAHGRIHLEDLGFTPTVAAAILGVRVGVSAAGRLSGSLGDFVPPRVVFALALIVNGVGLGGFVLADTPLVAYSCVVLLGVGYGAAYISIPVVFAHLFGRSAFVETAGLRIAITGLAGYVAPTWAGAVADRTGSYSGSLIVMMLFSLLGAVAIFYTRRPQRRATR